MMRFPRHFSLHCKQKILYFKQIFSLSLVCVEMPITFIFFTLTGCIYEVNKYTPEAIGCI